MVIVLKVLVGNGEGCIVIISFQIGIFVVCVMFDELCNVEVWFKVMCIVVECQVMLEVKIVEVELCEGYQSGIDWLWIGDCGVIGQISVNLFILSGVNFIINLLVSNMCGLLMLFSGM